MAEQRLSDFSARLPDGRAVPLAEKAGKVVLIVNTASQCGFTPQYAGLEKLWQDYGGRGFEVMAFPVTSSVVRNPAARRISRSSVR